MGRNRCECEQLGWYGSGWRLWECPCECGIEPPSPIDHGVSWFWFININIIIIHEVPGSIPGTSTILDVG